jgi:disulfide bond formation protein DsbB
VETRSVTLFLALLAIVAQLSVAAALVLAAGRSRLQPVRRRITEALGPQALPLAAVVALVCTAGSLYLSEVAHFPPCVLCWYQRIAMYPLVMIIGIAAWRKDYLVARYAVPLSAVGGAISIYHMFVERFPNLESGACDPNNPCSTIWVEHFGYLTIPTMALSGFALIAALTLAARSWSRQIGDVDD